MLFMKAGVVWRVSVFSVAKLFIVDDLQNTKNKTLFQFSGKRFLNEKRLPFSLFVCFAFFSFFSFSGLECLDSVLRPDHLMQFFGGGDVSFFLLKSSVDLLLLFHHLVDLLVVQVVADPMLVAILA